MAPERPRGEPGAPSGVRRVVRSIRFRITAVATLVVALVLAASAVVALTAQERVLTDSLDARLRRQADDIASLVAQGSVPSTLTAGGGIDDALSQVVTSDGRAVAASPNVGGAPPVAEQPPAGSTETLRTVDGLSIDNDPFRLLSRRVTSGDGSDLTIHVAEALDEVEESVSVLRVTLALLLPALLVLVAALVWTVVGRALRPVDAIRSEVARISGSALNRRVPEPATGDEIGRLAHTMNEMLDRLEQAHRSQQQFVADASHELRSPLTSIRSELEVDLAHPARADLLGTHRSVLEETERLQRLVDDLLVLARSDAEAAQPAGEAVDLDDIVVAEARVARTAGAAEIDLSGVSGAQVIGDADQLRRAARNLLENAVTHADQKVTVTLAETDGVAELVVADDGPGIPTDQSIRIFERFTRVDDARTRAHGGTGLGLAITHDIVVRHGGTIRAEPSTTGARMVVRIPLRLDGA